MGRRLARAARTVRIGMLTGEKAADSGRNTLARLIPVHDQGLAIGSRRKIGSKTAIASKTVLRGSVRSVCYTIRIGEGKSMSWHKSTRNGMCSGSAGIDDCVVKVTIVCHLLFDCIVERKVFMKWAMTVTMNGASSGVFVVPADQGPIILSTLSMLLSQMVNAVDCEIDINVVTAEMMAKSSVKPSGKPPAHNG